MIDSSDISHYDFVRPLSHGACNKPRNRRAFATLSRVSPRQRLAPLAHGVPVRLRHPSFPPPGFATRLRCAHWTQRRSRCHRLGAIAAVVPLRSRRRFITAVFMALPSSPCGSQVASSLPARRWVGFCGRQLNIMPEIMRNGLAPTVRLSPAQFALCVNCRHRI